MKVFGVGILALGVTAELTLEDLYGPMARVEAMTALGRRGKISSTYLNSRFSHTCDFPLEIVIVQDLTASFNDTFDLMINEQLPEMFKFLEATHPGTVYSVVTFRDKPIDPWGTPTTDFCEKFSFDFTDNSTAVKEYFRPLETVGGGDTAHNQFGALLASTQSRHLSWGISGVGARLIVLVTDAPPHFKGDSQDNGSLKPSTGKFKDNSAAEDCLKYYYPSPDQLLRSVQDVNAYFGVVVHDPNFWTGVTAKAWRWVTRFLGLTDDFARLSTADHSDLWDNLKQIIHNVEVLECKPFVPQTTAAVGETETTVSAYATPIWPTSAAPVETTVSAYATPIWPTSAAPVETTVSAYATPIWPTSAAPVETTMSAYATPIWPTSAKSTPLMVPTATPVGSEQMATTLPSVAPEAAVTDECHESIFCDENVLVKIGFPPDNLNVVVDGNSIV